MGEIFCPHKEKCIDHPKSCATCKHNTGKKSYYEPTNPNQRLQRPEGEYEPYDPWYRWYPFPTRDQLAVVTWCST